MIDESQNIDKMKIKYLEEIVRQKDIIINSQNLTIKSLTDQLLVMKYIETAIKVNEVPGANKISDVVDKRTTNKNQIIQKLDNNLRKGTDNPNVLNAPSVSHAIHQTEAQLMCEKFINLTNDTPECQTQSSMKQRKRDNPKNILTGKMAILSDCPFKAAAVNHANNLYYYHTTNFDVETCETALHDYLTKFAPSCKIEKLNSRNPHKYVSFKICVLSSEAQNILKDEI